MIVCARTWVQAESETEGERAQIQGFTYPKPKAGFSDKEESDDAGVLVIRDVSSKDNQVLWKREFGPGEYEAAHKEMMHEIRVKCAEITAIKYFEIGSGVSWS